jgi:hypothetical protein
MAVVQAVKSSVSNVKVLAQKTAELPELIEDACSRPELVDMGRGNGMNKEFIGTCHVCCAV